MRIKPIIEILELLFFSSRDSKFKGKHPRKRLSKVALFPRDSKFMETNTAKSCDSFPKSPGTTRAKLDTTSTLEYEL